MARGFRGRLRRDARRGPRAARLRETLVLEDDWAALLAGGAQVGDAELAAREASLLPDDPINIQFTSGTTGSPKGATLTHRNILNNARFTGARDGATPSTTACASRCPSTTAPAWSWARCAAPRTARASSSPASRSTPRRCSRRSRPSAAPRSTACRRCSSPRWPPALRALRPLEPAHRDHRRRALPGRRDAAHPRGHAHGEVTIVYGMTETSPVSTQTALDDPRREAHRDRRPRAPARRGQDRRPRDRRDRPARRRPASTARAATASCSATGTIPEATAAAIDADGWMHTGDLAIDGRRRLRPHRRPHQGHDHPRRREHLPARDRGVPAHARPTSPRRTWSACRAPATARR